MSGVLPNASQIDIGVTMASKHQALYALAAQFNGACTKRFGQGSDHRGKGLGYWYHQRAGWHGVCKALSVYWIFFHALDQDFWGWLYGPNGRIDAQKAAKIIDLHAAYKSRSGGLTKDGWTDQKLLGAHLIPRSGIVSGARLKVTGVANQSNPYLAGRLIGDSIAPTDYEGGSYKQLSFHNPDGGGHAVAAWVERDVAFFDPNYGEYWFETKADFRKWFGKFWVTTGYGAKYTGDYNFTAYARKVN